LVANFVLTKFQIIKILLLLTNFSLVTAVQAAHGAAVETEQ